VTLRRRALAAVTTLLVLGAGATGVAAWARALRQETLDLFIALDRSATGMAQVEQCLHDHHRQVTLLVQALGGSSEGLDPTLRDSLDESVKECHSELTQLEAAGTGYAPESGIPTLLRESRNLLELWDSVANDLGQNPVAAITRQATLADPLAERILNEMLPTAREEQAEQLVRARQSFVEASARADSVILTAMIAAVVVVALTTGLLLRRVVAGLDALTAALQNYAGGAFDHRVRLHGDDELATVGRQVNDMAERLANARKELEQRAADLQSTIHTLQAAQATIVRQEKMAALGDLVAGVAHEVNTPLGVAVTTTSLLTESLQELSHHAEAGTATRGMLRRVLADASTTASLLSENLRRAAQLIQSFKQVAVDRGVVDTREARLRAWANGLIQSLTPLTRRYRVQLHLDVPDDAHLVLAAGELEQVVTNLIVNACTHGYGEASPETSGERPVRVEVTVSETHLVLGVQDHGAGMPTEVAHRVFEPFFTTRRGQGGTGLGMHIVHQLITERFAGEVQLDTGVGRGTRWTLRLPLNTDALHRFTRGSSSP
jgi:signal transduction histidine kinase